MTKKKVYEKFIAKVVWQSIRKVYSIPSTEPTDAQRRLIQEIVSATYTPLASKYKKPELEQLLSEVDSEV